MIKKLEMSDPESCFNRAHIDEPVFVLLGRDKSAAVAIRAWIFNRLATGKSIELSPEIVEARRFVEVMERYAEARGKEVK
jgi:hypothetical protein